MRYLRRYIVSIFLVFFLHPVLASTDKWYESAPSCVIERGNPARTGEYITKPIEKFHKILWETKLKGRITPLCYQGNVITTSPALWDIKHNKPIWRHELGYAVAGFTLYKNILYTFIYKFNKPLQLIGYDINTGDIVLDKTFNSESGSRISPLIYNDILYIPLNGAVLAFNLQHQSIIWQQPIKALNELSTDGYRLYFSTFGKKSIIALDIKTGKPVWLYPSKAAGYISLYKGKVYFLSDEKLDDTLIFRLHALDATNGQVLWQTDLSRTTNKAYLAINKDFIFAIDRKGLTAIDIKTGKKRWTFQAKLTEVPSVAGNTVYVRNTRLIYAVDASTGKLKSSISAPSEDGNDGILGSMVPYNNQLIANTAHIGNYDKTRVFN